MKHHGNDQFLRTGEHTSHDLVAIPAFSILSTYQNLVAAEDIVAGMEIELEDGTFSKVVSVLPCSTVAPCVKVSVCNADRIIFSDVYLKCRHPLCELYFGSPEVAYPVNAIVGHDPAFSWQCATEPTQFLALQLERQGWVKLDGREIFIPPFQPELDRGHNVKAIGTMSGTATCPPLPAARLCLSREETIVLGQLNCALAEVLSSTKVASDHLPNLAGLA